MGTTIDARARKRADVIELAAARTEGSPYLSMGETARRLGLYSSQLCVAAKVQAFYAPDIRGLPGIEAPICRRVTRYHIEHVRMMERAITRQVAFETVEAEWKRWKEGTAGVGCQVSGDGNGAAEVRGLPE